MRNSTNSGEKVVLQAFCEVEKKMATDNIVQMKIFFANAFYFSFLPGCIA